MNVSRRHLLGVFFALVLVVRLAAGVTVGAAANLTYVLEPLAEAFRKQHPDVRLETVIGASGTLYAQVKHGAPYDVFLSADVEYPRRLAEEGLAEKASYVVFARGRLAFWSVRHPLAGADLERLLHDGRFQRIALANPTTAPYGQAAREVLKRLKLWDAASPQHVTGENIAQTAQFVESGNADAGFVALSLLRSPKLANKGEYVLVPEDWHAPLDHAAVLTRRGASNEDARAFLQFLATPEAKKVLDAYGYASR